MYLLKELPLLRTPSPLHLPQTRIACFDTDTRLTVERTIWNIYLERARPLYVNIMGSDKRTHAVENGPPALRHIARLRLADHLNLTSCVSMRPWEIPRSVVIDEHYCCCVLSSFDLGLVSRRSTSSAQACFPPIPNQAMAAKITPLLLTTSPQ